VGESLGDLEKEVEAQNKLGARNKDKGKRKGKPNKGIPRKKKKTSQK